MDVIRVLIVDDSPTMRRLIRAGIERDPAIKVVAEAGTAREARDAVKTVPLDVITLDVEMPGMDGIEFLERLMRSRPMPVVMISSLTAKGSDAAVRALSLGAIECIEKPRFGAARETFTQVVEILKMAATAQVGRGGRWVKTPPAQEPKKGSIWNGKTILIGASTGGVDAIETVLSGFPEDCPPTLITQHMPGSFLVSFAARLNASVSPTVRVAQDGDRVTQGSVLIAPGDLSHMHLAGAKGDQVTLKEGPKTSGHRPSVDEMFSSAVPFAQNVVAALLTGMGRDGAEGMSKLRHAGAYCIGQDKESCVVYGMPRIARELGAIQDELPLREISAAVLARTTKNSAMGGRKVAI